jgi:hypothetical protein
LNYFIIGFLITIIVSRLVQSVGINIISIKSLLSKEEIDHKKELYNFWVFFRGILSPVRDLLELCLIIYFLHFQDNRNRKTMRPVSLGRGRVAKDNYVKDDEKVGFFKKVGIESEEGSNQSMNS